MCTVRRYLQVAFCDQTPQQSKFSSHSTETIEKIAPRLKYNSTRKAFNQTRANAISIWTERQKEFNDTELKERASTVEVQRRIQNIDISTMTRCCLVWRAEDSKWNVQTVTRYRPSSINNITQ